METFLKAWFAGSLVKMFWKAILAVIAVVVIVVWLTVGDEPSDTRTPPTTTPGTTSLSMPGIRPVTFDCTDFCVDTTNGIDTSQDNSVRVGSSREPATLRATVQTAGRLLTPRRSPLVDRETGDPIAAVEVWYSLPDGCTPALCPDGRYTATISTSTGLAAPLTTEHVNSLAFPLPADGHITITLNDTQTGEQMKLTVTADDIYGN